MNKKKLCFYIDVNLIKKIEDYTKKTLLKKSTIVNEAIRKYIDSKKIL